MRIVAGQFRFMHQRLKERGRRRWKKMSGYHGQARVENAFFRYKSIIGDSLRACSPAGRGTEVVLACNILNQMTGLGRPMSHRIGRRRNCGSESVRASSDSCNNAAPDARRRAAGSPRPPPTQ